MLCTTADLGEDLEPNNSQISWLQKKGGGLPLHVQKYDEDVTHSTAKAAFYEYKQKASVRVSVIAEGEESWQKQA